jgi:hypothetical protein
MGCASSTSLKATQGRQSRDLTDLPPHQDSPAAIVNTNVVETTNNADPRVYSGSSAIQFYHEDDAAVNSTNNVNIGFHAAASQDSLSDLLQSKSTVKMNEIGTNFPMTLKLIHATYHDNDISDSVASFIRSDGSLELLGGIKGKDVNEVSISLTFILLMLKFTYVTINNLFFLKFRY